MTLHRHHRIVALQVLTLLLVLLPLAGGGYFIWAKHQEWTARLKEAEPRHARLQGILAEQQGFERAAQGAQSLMGAMAYAATVEPGVAANEVQEKVQTLLGEGGLKVQIQQTREDPPEGAFVPMRLSVRIDGHLDQLQPALLKLRAHNPLLIVERLQLNNDGPLAKGSRQRLSGTVDLVAWRVRS